MLGLLRVLLSRLKARAACFHGLWIAPMNREALRRYPVVPEDFHNGTATRSVARACTAIFFGEVRGKDQKTSSRADGPATTRRYSSHVRRSRPPVRQQPQRWRKPSQRVSCALSHQPLPQCGCSKNPCSWISEVSIASCSIIQRVHQSRFCSRGRADARRNLRRRKPRELRPGA